MSRFIVRRVFYMLVTMMVATLLVFSLSRIVGDPRLLYVQEGGYGLSPEAWDALGVKLHLEEVLRVEGVLESGAPAAIGDGATLHALGPMNREPGLTLVTGGEEEGVGGALNQPRAVLGVGDAVQVGRDT